MGERKRPWQMEPREKPVRNTQIKYMWETSIPASWKKIKGERHFQRHMTTLRVALPTIEKALLALFSPQSPIRMRKKLPVNEERGKVWAKGAVLRQSCAVSRENSPSEDNPRVHFSESPSRHLQAVQHHPSHRNCPCVRSGHVPAKELDQ